MKTVVTAIIKNPNKTKFLILQRPKSATIHPRLWTFPGGIIKKGEDVITALKREIKEETGLDTNDDFKQISEYEYQRPTGETTHGICYTCTTKNEHTTLNHESTNSAWITPKEFKHYPHLKELDQEITQAFPT